MLDEQRGLRLIGCVLRALDVSTSYLSTIARGTGGLFCGASHLGARPAKLLELYEFEACPFCRKVREMLTFLDLEALVYPCPKGGTRYRSAVAADGGKAQFPRLIDPNTGEKMYESSDIVRYLARTYGDGTIPLGLSLGPVPIVSGSIASLIRGGSGGRVRPSRAPAQALELWSFEASPYCRIVREALCELEIPYRLHNVGKGSPSRGAFVARAGRMMVPYLVDPNTGTSLFESGEIVGYLEGTYAALAVCVEGAGLVRFFRKPAGARGSNANALRISPRRGRVPVLIQPRSTSPPFPTPRIPHARPARARATSTDGRVAPDQLRANRRPHSRGDGGPPRGS